VSMKEIGVGVIGAGRIGLVHLEALAGCVRALVRLVEIEVGSPEVCLCLCRVARWTGARLRGR
jgi:predicted dehydrogenase